MVPASGLICAYRNDYLNDGSSGICCLLRVANISINRTGYLSSQVQEASGGYGGISFRPPEIFDDRSWTGSGRKGSQIWSKGSGEPLRKEVEPGGNQGGITGVKARNKGFWEKIFIGENHNRG